MFSLQRFYAENDFQKQAYAKKYSLEWKMWQLALDSPIFWELRWSFFSFGWSSYCYWLNSRLGNKGWSSSRCVYVFVCVCVCVKERWMGWCQAAVPGWPWINLLICGLPAKPMINTTPSVRTLLFITATRLRRAQNIKTLPETD